MISKNGRPKFAQKVKVAREQLNGHARARETAERLRRPTSFSGIICSQYFFLLLSFSFYLDLLKKIRRAFTQKEAQEREQRRGFAEKPGESCEISFCN